MKRFSNNEHGIFPYPKGVKKSTIPACEFRKWKIDKIILTRADVGLNNLRALRDGFPEQCASPGKYTRLVYNGHVIVMSDTRLEALTNLSIIQAAHGNVMINGLGMGFVLENILRNPEVKHVRVFEIDPDLIALVKPFFMNGDGHLENRVQFIEANALERVPTYKEKYDVVWHDIWSNICSDNLKEIKILTQRWKRRCTWQGAWAHAQVLRLKSTGY